MEKEYRKIYLFFVLILFLVPIGFKRYFKLFPEFVGVNSVVHFHAIVMLLWCILLIVQPILIQTGNQKIHRSLGKFSYLFTPIVILSMFMILDHQFQRGVNSGEDEATTLAGLFFPTSQTLLFIIFYSLAIFYRKTPKIHMRYIIVSSIVLFGPTIGRVDFSFIGLGDFAMDAIFMDFVITLLILNDHLKKKWYPPYFIGAFAYLLVHFSTYFVPESIFWQSIGKLFFT